MTASLNDMLNTFRTATLQYKLTGNPAQKPAADRAKNAIESYLANLERTVQQRENQLRNYVDSKAGVPNEVRQLSQKSQELRQNTNQIAAKYLVASNLTEPTPVDWSQFYVKFAVIVGLAGAVGMVTLIR
jgi:chromosome segregation ATPase